MINSTGVPAKINWPLLTAYTTPLLAMCILKLIITDGVGYHQIKGQPRQTIKKGDVVKCPPNVLHWHGASPDTGLQQIYILPKTEKGIVT